LIILNKIIEQFIVYKYSTIVIDYINYKLFTNNNNSIDLNTISTILENF